MKVTSEFGYLLSLKRLRLIYNLVRVSTKPAVPHFSVGDSMCIYCIKTEAVS